MRLELDAPPPKYKSASQKARVTTESWIAENFYCPSCGSGLSPYPHGHRVYDFTSASCGEDFQLKSASHRFGSTVLGSEYRTTLNSILNNLQHSLILLSYERDKWIVENLSLVHRGCITSTCIIPRKPLSSSARRAGWEGCLISLERIPKLGQIEVVNGRQVRAKSEVLAQLKQTHSLLTTPTESRGWLTDILSCVERLLSSFSLGDVYAFEDELVKRHPNNHNIRPKIRQQLQVLRDLKLVKFVGPGRYQYLGKFTESWRKSSKPT